MFGIHFELDLLSQLNQSLFMIKYQSSCPSFMKEHHFEKFFPIQVDKIDAAWQKLQLRESFVKGQIFPYRVEFDSLQQMGPFQEGELNIHHGPFLSAHGVIGKVEATYRDLQYFYGSYVLSFRWIRPVRLEFHKEKDGIRLQLKTYVTPWMHPLWSSFNSVFWNFAGLF